MESQHGYDLTAVNESNSAPSKRKANNVEVTIDPVNSKEIWMNKHFVQNMMPNKDQRWLMVTPVKICYDQ